MLPPTKCSARSLCVKRSLVPVLLLLVWTFGAECLAQQTTEPSTALAESLSEEVNDPTATLTQAQIQEFFTPSEFGTNAQPNTLQGRFILAVLLHGPLNFAQIVRPTFSLVTIPQNRGASTRTEFGDLQLLDLFVMPRWMTEGIDFRWAIGPYFVFPTASSSSAGRGAWQAGPAAAFRYRPIRGLLISGLMQQATSFAYTSPERTPVSRLTFQPMLSYQLGRGWYVRSSDAIWAFNVRHATSTTIPLSAGLGKVWNVSTGEAINGSIAGEWIVYRQFAPRAQQFTLKFQRGQDARELLQPYFVMTGNPGTGKTTVARIMGHVFKELGYLPSDHVVETGREDLVAGYIGQTAIKTRTVLEKALGGTLFIDEAYSLTSRQAGGQDYGSEAIETLLKFMRTTEDAS